MASTWSAHHESRSAFMSRPTRTVADNPASTNENVASASTVALPMWRPTRRLPTANTVMTATVAWS